MADITLSGWAGPHFIG